MDNSFLNVSRDKIEFLNNDFKIIAIDQTQRRTTKSCHEEIEIKYFYKGESTLMIDGKLFFPKKGDITIANPYEVHSRVNVDKQDGRYYMLIISLDFFTNFNSAIDLRKSLLSDGLRFCNFISGNERLQSIILQVMEETSAEKSHYKNIVKCLLSEFFLLLMRDYLDNGKVFVPDKKIVKKTNMLSPALTIIHSCYRC